jgi:hypothetical protein
MLLALVARELKGQDKSLRFECKIVDDQPWCFNISLISGKKPEIKVSPKENKIFETKSINLNPEIDLTEVKGLTLDHFKIFPNLINFNSDMYVFPSVVLSDSAPGINLEKLFIWSAKTNSLKVTASKTFTKLLVLSLCYNRITNVERNICKDAGIEVFGFQRK